MDLLSLVISDAVDHQLLVVGTARDPDPGRESPAPKVFDLSKNSLVSTLPLSRFDAQEVERFVRDAGGEGLLGETLRLRERSGGNPFYLRQLVSLLRGRASANAEMLQLPQTMREAVLAHLGSLAPELVETLQVASVIGRDFPEDLLAAVLEVSPERVQELLESAASRGIVERASHGSHKFEHVLVQEALYSMLPRLECGRAHLRIAEALQLAPDQASGPGEASAVAHHRYSALPTGSVEEAIDAAVTAARLAYRSFALDQAAEHCRVALSLLAGSERRDQGRELEIRLELSKALLGSGLREDGRACLSEAARLAFEAEAGDRIAEIALSVAPGFLSIETGVVDEFLVDRLERALEIEDLHPSTRAQLTARLALALYWSPEAGARDLLMPRAESLAELGGDEHVKAIVAVHGTAARWSPATFGERHEGLADLGAAARASGDRSVELLAAVLRVTTLMEAGDLGAADRGIAQLSRLVDDSGDPLARWYPIAMTAMRSLLAGRYEEATREVARYSQLGKRFGDSNVDQTALMQLGEAAWQVGHAESVLELVRTQADRVRATPEWRCALALVLALCGRKSASVAEARSVLVDFALLSERINGSVGWAALAMACSLSRQESLAADLYDWGAGLASATIVGGYGMLCWGSREFFLGVLAGSCGDLGKCEEHLLAAVDENTRFGSPPWIAHARFALSELYGQRGGRGDSGRSVEHAAEARALSSSSGLQLNSFVRGRGRQ
ncbi:MAG: hypothetical protein OER77_06940 [Myxococcales bacterium]|nr:hypothetical protein [Myxococcales bacterium]